MDRSTEAALIVEVLQGSHEAYQELVGPHLGLFAAGIQRILHGPQETQRALEEALMSIHASLPRFRQEAHFSSWSYHICIEEALKFRRSRSKGSWGETTPSFWSQSLGRECSPGEAGREETGH